MSCTTTLALLRLHAAEALQVPAAARVFASGPLPQDGWRELLGDDTTLAELHVVPGAELRVLFKDGALQDSQPSSEAAGAGFGGTELAGL